MTQIQVREPLKTGHEWFRPYKQGAAVTQTVCGTHSEPFKTGLVTSGSPPYRGGNHSLTPVDPLLPLPQIVVFREGVSVRPTALRLLLDLEAREFSVALEDGALVIDPPHALTEADRAGIDQCRDQLEAMVRMCTATQEERSQTCRKDEDRRQQQMPYTTVPRLGTEAPTSLHQSSTQKGTPHA